MKRTPQLITAQMNLSLKVSTLANAVPQEKQKELKLALVDLLTNAACPKEEESLDPDPAKGGKDEFQTNS